MECTCNVSRHNQRLDPPCATLEKPGHNCLSRTRSGQLGALGGQRVSWKGESAKPWGWGSLEPVRPWFHLGLQCCLAWLCFVGLGCSKRSSCNTQICLQVTDRRDMVFQKPAGSFPGLGQVVGTSESSRVQETSKIPGKILNLPQKRCSVWSRKILKPSQGSAGGRKGM